MTAIYQSQNDPNRISALKYVISDEGFTALKDPNDFIVISLIIDGGFSRVELLVFHSPDLNGSNFHHKLSWYRILWLSDLCSMERKFQSCEFHQKSKHEFGSCWILARRLYSWRADVEKVVKSHSDLMMADLFLAEINWYRWFFSVD